MRPHRWRCRPRREYQRSSRNARRRAGAGAAGRARAGRQRRSDRCRRGTRRGRARRGDRARGARRRRSPARRGGGQGRRLGGARLRASERAGAAARRDRRVDATLMASRYGLPRMVTVCTFLPPPERPRVDAAGDGCFTTLHANSLRDALHAARRKRVDALVLSVHRCRGDELPAVARFVREFPAIPAVALVSRHDRDVTETLLKLGATGARTAVDCTEAAGWRRLRDLLAHPASPVAARILARVVPALDDVPEDVRVFFEALARLAPVLSTVR